MSYIAFIQTLMAFFSKDTFCPSGDTRAIASIIP